MWLSRLIEAIALDVSDLPNNRHPRCLRRWTTPFDSHSHRISIAEVALRQRLINQDNLRCLPVVCGGEEAAAFQRCLHRPKVIRRDRPNLRCRDSVVRNSVTFDRKAAVIMWTNEGHGITAADRGAAHARDRTHTLQQVLDKPGALQRVAIRIEVRIVWHRQPDAREHYVLRIETRIHFKQTAKTPQK